MVDNTNDIARMAAERAMPGWRAIPAAVRQTANDQPTTDAVGADMVRLKQKYLNADSVESSASSDPGETVFVTMESRGSENSGPMQRKVIVTQGKVSGFQG